MGVYKREGSAYWQYEFELKGKRYRGSTERKLKHEAQAFEVKRRAEVESDHRAQREGVKHQELGVLAADWLAAARLTHSDWRNDESRVRKLFGRQLIGGVEVVATYLDSSGSSIPRFAFSASLKVHELSQGLMLQLRDARIREGNSPATVNREMALIQSLIGYAQATSVVTPSPALVFTSKRAKTGSLKLKEPEGKLRYLSTAEETALFAALTTKLEESRDSKGVANPLIQDQIDMCVFLLDTGARYNEVAKITWDVIDMDSGNVDLYRGKGGRASTLRMTARLRRVLEARKESAGTKRYIFQAGGGTRSHSAVDAPRGHATKGIQRTMDALGFNSPAMVAAKGKVTPHTFRDTFASRLVQAGFSLYEVQALLGHASPAMTQKYAKLQVTDVSARASAVLNGGIENSFRVNDDPRPNGLLSPRIQELLQ